MTYNYTNEELAKRYLSIRSQDGCQDRSRRGIAKKIRNFEESVSGCFSIEGSLEFLKGFSLREKRILELILTEGDKARDIYYREMVEEQRRKHLVFTGGHRRGSYIDDDSDDPQLANNIRILEGN